VLFSALAPSPPFGALVDPAARPEHKLFRVRSVRGDMADPETFAVDLDASGTFVALGGTYAAHHRRESAPRWPILWTVPHASVVPEGEPIRIPDGVERVEPGTELVAVLDEPLWQADAAAAAAAVRGFTVSNDAKAMGEFPGYPYPDMDVETDDPVGRGFHIMPTFSPTLTEGVALDPSEVGDLAVETYVDGERVVASSTAEMAWSVGEMLAHVSRVLRLEPGDLVSLGDPAFPGAYLEDADEVVCRIEEVGELRNPVVAD
jgi:2-keto-4-pentenoate hydratase/2-oxohepta-3-ene-1,7-dioic acid hydratase in catechol pathway